MDTKDKINSLFKTVREKTIDTSKWLYNCSKDVAIKSYDFGSKRVQETKTFKKKFKKMGKTLADYDVSSTPERKLTENLEMIEKYYDKKMYRTEIDELVDYIMSVRKREALSAYAEPASTVNLEDYKDSSFMIVRTVKNPDYKKPQLTVDGEKSKATLTRYWVEKRKLNALVDNKISIN